MPNLLATMVTTTTFGSWLPGDLRGYVEDGIILPANSARLEQATKRMNGRSPVLFTIDQQTKVFNALRTAADEFKYEMTDASIESWHLHWMCGHGYDSVATMVGRLKNRMRQALNLGRIWTEGYYDSMCFDVEKILIRRKYIARHEGCRLTDGKIIDPNSPY
jgi:REP element-mobilizing transposase RayT